MSTSRASRIFAALDRWCDVPPIRWQVKFFNWIADQFRRRPVLWVPFGAIVLAEWVLLYVTRVVGK